MQINVIIFSAFWDGKNGFLCRIRKFENWMLKRKAHLNLKWNNKKTEESANDLYFLSNFIHNWSDYPTVIDWNKKNVGRYLASTDKRKSSYKDLIGEP